MARLQIYPASVWQAQASGSTELVLERTQILARGAGVRVRCAPFAEATCLATLGQLGRVRVGEEHPGWGPGLQLTDRNAGEPDTQVPSRETLQ